MNYAHGYTASLFWKSLPTMMQVCHITQNWSMVQVLLRRSWQPSLTVFRKKSSSFWVFALFMPPLFPVDIRGANHPGQSSLPLVDHTEFDDLKFPVPECPLMVQVCLAPSRNAGAPCCNEPVVRNNCVRRPNSSK